MEGLEVGQGQLAPKTWWGCNGREREVVWQWHIDEQSCETCHRSTNCHKEEGKVVQWDCQRGVIKMFEAGTNMILQIVVVKDSLSDESTSFGIGHTGEHVIIDDMILATNVAGSEIKNVTNSAGVIKRDALKLTTMGTGSPFRQFLPILKLWIMDINRAVPNVAAVKVMERIKSGALTDFKMGESIRKMIPKPNHMLKSKHP